MALQHLDTAPKAQDFTPLQEHQEQTPSTFFGSKPVLYAHHSRLTLSISATDLQTEPAFAKFSAVADDAAADSLVKNVDIWVNSKDLIFFQHTPTPTGVAIPYPSIGLHATMKWKSQADALFMNISLNDAEAVNDDDDIEILEITVLPPDYDSTPDSACIKEIFSAMNACADLHPDPNDSDAEDEDETAPGATGWITTDNMDDYLDEDGNFIRQVVGGEELGPGAGTVRQREDDGEEHTNGVNGASEDTKWQRTD